jgi:hypothetical protein
MPDGNWLLGLADGQNRSVHNGLVATAGGTKAAALAVPAAAALVQFGTVATNGDSGLLPDAVSGTVICIQNAGAATLSLYASGNDTINGGAAAANYDLAANGSAIFFCVVNGNWSAVKSA